MNYDSGAWKEVQVHLINRIQLGYQSESIYKRNQLGTFRFYSQL